jgi:hypothetical protein
LKEKAVSCPFGLSLSKPRTRSSLTALAFDGAQSERVADEQMLCFSALRPPTLFGLSSSKPREVNERQRGFSTSPASCFLAHPA